MKIFNATFSHKKSSRYPVLRYCMYIHISCVHKANSNFIFILVSQIANFTTNNDLPPSLYMYCILLYNHYIEINIISIVISTFCNRGVTNNETNFNKSGRINVLNMFRCWWNRILLNTFPLSHISTKITFFFITNTRQHYYKYHSINI